MKANLHNPIFDNIVIENADPDDFKKQRATDVLEAGFSENNYVSYEQLEERFGLSHYQISKCLEKIGAQPIGVKKSVVNGKRLRGPGKHVFGSNVIEEIDSLLHKDVDVEAIKALAALVKKGGEPVEQ